MTQANTPSPPRFKAGENVLFRAAEEGGVIVNVNSGKCWELNEAGQLSWTVLAAGGTLDDAVAKITDAFRVDSEVARRDCETLLTTLTTAGLLEPA